MMIAGCKEPCEPQIISLSPEIFELLPDNHYPELVFKNSEDSLFDGQQMSFTNDIDYGNNPCYKGYERVNLSYEVYGYFPVGHLTYFAENSSCISISMGESGHPFNYNSSYIIDADSLNLYEYSDTLLLLNETFYDVYHIFPEGYETHFVGDLYYNKKYGVVAFYAWGGLYVLDTDGL